MGISLVHKSITIDVNNRNAPNVVAIANVNDKAVRYLDVTLTASGEKLTFADCTITATFATDGYLISDSVACTLNSTADVITVPLENFKSMSGFLSIEIKIASGETQVLNTPLTLKVMVTPSLAENSKINSESAGSFAEISREVATARGSSNSLGARLDTVDANLTKKANKSDIDSINSRLQSAEQNLHSKANATDVSNALKSKEDNSNKVSSKTDITDSSANYPSIKYLNDYYYNLNETYSSAETDELLGNKADINSVYSKVDTDNLLGGKADKADVANQFSKLKGDLDEINDLFLKKVCYLTYDDFTTIGFYNLNQSGNINQSLANVGYRTCPVIKLKKGTYYFSDSVRAYFTIYKDSYGNSNRFSSTDTAFSGAKTFETDVELYITIPKSATGFYLVDGDTAPTGEVTKGIISLDTKTKLDSVVALENEIKAVKPTTIYVEKDGTGDFSTLKGAVEYAFNNPNTTVYVGSGIYDLIEEFGSDYFANLGNSSSNAGLRLGNNVHIIFSSNSKVVCNYDGDNANVNMYFSPFNCSVNNNHKGFTLENLDLECSNVRYAIHDESLGQRGRYINRYKNCRVYIDNTSNSNWTNRHCIGGGLGGNGYIEIDGCYFESVARSSNPGGAPIVSYHCGQGRTDDNYCSKVIIKNSYFANNDTARCSYYGNQTTMSSLTISGCSLGSAPYCGQENPNYTTVNMKLIEFNNTVRES